MAILKLLQTPRKALVVEYGLVKFMAQFHDFVKLGSQNNIFPKNVPKFSEELVLCKHFWTAVSEFTNPTPYQPACIQELGRGEWRGSQY